MAAHTNIMTGSMHWNMAHGVSCVSSVTQHVMQMTRLECMQDSQGACRNHGSSRETLSCKVAERYASPADCCLMTPAPQEYVMGNLCPVAETANVAMLVLLPLSLVLMLVLMLVLLLLLDLLLLPLLLLPLLLLLSCATVNAQ